MEWPRARLILQQAVLWEGTQAAGMALPGAETEFNWAELTEYDLQINFCPFFLLTIALRLVVQDLTS